MKSTFKLMLPALAFFSYAVFNTTDPKKHYESADANDSGYIFDVDVTQINSEYSEIPSAVFRDKLVIVSSKKIGAIGNGRDEKTGLPFTNLFCSDIAKRNEDLSTPILFSRILNSKDNEGQVAFSPDEMTIYYTRSERDNSANYQLYVADLEPGSYGYWKNHRPVSFNNEKYSVESPHISADGKYLYFSSNMEGGLGGFDIYRSEISENGVLGSPVNLGPTINTEYDENYPHTSKNGKEFFFSSTGHTGQGGYDIFIANDYGKLNYSAPRNLGIKINSLRDDIAFTLIDEDRGVYASNEGSVGRRFNMYRFNARAIYQDLEGVILEKDGISMANTTVVLYDSNGNELERQVTDKNGIYRFKIRPFQAYKLKTVRDGYDDVVFDFKSNNTRLNYAYREDLRISPKGEVAK